MNHQDATTLAARLDFVAHTIVRVWTDRTWIHFAGLEEPGQDPAQVPDHRHHTIAIGGSDEARTLAHFRGFLDHYAPKKGDRVRFRRGQYGTWTGIVEHAGQTKAEPRWYGCSRIPYYRIRFTRRHGGTGALRVKAGEVIKVISRAEVAP